MLGDFDRFVEAVEILQSAAQSVEGVSEGGIGGQGLAILLDRLFVVAFGDVIERGVVVVFGLLAAASELAGSSGIFQSLAILARAALPIRQETT